MFFSGSSYWASHAHCHAEPTIAPPQLVACRDTVSMHHGQWPQVPKIDAAGCQKGDIEK